MERAFRVGFDVVVANFSESEMCLDVEDVDVVVVVVISSCFFNLLLRLLLFGFLNCWEFFEILCFLVLSSVGQFHIIGREFPDYLFSMGASGVTADVVFKLVCCVCGATTLFRFGCLTVVIILTPLHCPLHNLFQRPGTSEDSKLMFQHW